MLSPFQQALVQPAQIETTLSSVWVNNWYWHVFWLSHCKLPVPEWISDNDTFIQLTSDENPQRTAKQTPMTFDPKT